MTDELCLCKDCSVIQYEHSRKEFMLHLPKFLNTIKSNSTVLRQKDLNYILGLTTTQIKGLKKYAIAEGLIQESKREYFVTTNGERYLSENPIISWVNVENPQRPEINLEYLKLDKAPPTLTKAIRCLARHLIEDEDLKENSTEHYLIKELLCSKSTCAEVKKEIEAFILKDGEQKLTCLFEQFMNAPLGLTKSIIAVLLLDALVKNKDILAIYENSQFQLKLTPLMFDRMIYCPQNFSLRKTQMNDMPILEDISAVILPCKSKNILDLTKGLIYFTRNLDKYTLSTERLNKPTLRFRNTILNAKDPISLFYRDIPKILDDKILCQCGENFVKALDEAVQELQKSYSNLIQELGAFLFEAFCETSREQLSRRFLAVGEYLSDSELKILGNNIANSISTDSQWIERIATFINKSRVPKDWSDNDVADFKVKVKDLAERFLIIETTMTNKEFEIQGLMANALENILNLLPTKQEKMAIARRVING